MIVNESRPVHPDIFFLDRINMLPISAVAQGKRQIVLGALVCPAESRFFLCAATSAAKIMSHSPSKDVCA